MRSLLAVIAFLAAGVAIVAAGPDGARGGEAETLADLVMANLRAKPTRCPRRLVRQDGLMRPRCGKVHSSFEEREIDVLRMVDGVLASRAPAADADLTWIRDGDAYWRSQAIGSGVLTVEYEASTRRIALHDRRLPEDCREVDSVPHAAWPYSNPVLLPESKIEPDYPGGLMTGRKEGLVILGAVIRKDGSVGPVCVLAAKPAGMGFEKAAMAAVKQWRYVPAKKDGEPVDTRFTVYVDFRMH